MGVPGRMWIWVLAVIVAVIGRADAEQSLTGFSPVFGDGMVLDRRAAKVYGRATKRDRIKVRVQQRDGGVKYTVNAVVYGKSKFWVAQLRDHAKTSKGELFDVTLETASGYTEVLENVLFGDVYFCSGQSNMALSLENTFQREFLQSELENGAFYERIRMFSLTGRDIRPANAKSKKPLPILWAQPFTDGWESPTSLISSGRFEETSALCLGFAYNLAKTVSSVPIGIVVSAFGASGIEAWMEKRVTRQCKGAMRTGGAGLPLQSLYNGMVFPFVNMKMKGVVFYQGERNIGNPGTRGKKATGYACLLPKMIQNWRRAFRDNKLFFGIISLAPGSDSLYSYNLPQVRYAQMGAESGDPNTKLIHAYDLPDPYPKGDPCESSRCCPRKGEDDFKAPAKCKVRSCGDPVDGPWCSYYTPLLGTAIHPRLKFRLSVRLAATVAGALYDGTEEVFGPKFSECKLSSAGKVEVTFHTGKQAIGVSNPLVPNTAFQICTDDQEACACPFWMWQKKGRWWVCSTKLWVKVKTVPKWQPLESPISRESSTTISFNLPDNKPVFAMRYAWGENPCCDETSEDFRRGLSPCSPQNCQIRTTNAASLPPDPFYILLDQINTVCNHITDL